MTKIKFKIWLPIILVLGFAYGLAIGANGDTVSSDEVAHIPAGWVYAKYGIFNLNNEHPPLMKLLSGLFMLPLNLNFPVEFTPETINWDQWYFGDLLLFHSGNDLNKLLFMARIPVMLMAVGIVIGVFFFAKKLANNYWAGIIAMILAIFSSILLAHGRLANTDTPLTFFYFMSFFALWWFLEKPNFIRSLILGLACGGALAVKFSAPIIAPIIVLLAIIYFIWVKKPYPIGKAIYWMLFSVLVAVLLVWIVYIYVQRSEIFSEKSITLSQFFNHQTISGIRQKLLLYPLDGYLDGFKVVKNHSLDGHPALLFGEFKITGWWYYFPVSFYYKTELTVQFLLLFSLVAMIPLAIKNKNGYGWTLMLICIIIYMIFSIFNRINIGVRHIMPIYPFVWAMAGAGAVWLIKSWIWRGVLVLLLGFMIYDSVLHFPTYIGYFNQLVPSNHDGYKYLADSNVYWSQEEKRIAQYLQSIGVNEIYYSYPNQRLEYYGIEVKRYDEKRLIPKGSYVYFTSQDKALPPFGVGGLDWLIKDGGGERVHHVGYSAYIYQTK